jgi:hypothetical protein
MTVRLENWRRLADDSGRTRLGYRDDLVTALLSTVLVIGLYLDGWSHVSVLKGALGAFLSPWHALLFAGFTATALWVSTRNQRLPSWSVDDVPTGYGLSIVGLALGAVGLAGDLAWHALVGVETGLAVLLAPFHLALFVSAGLIVAAPFRAAWRADRWSGPWNLRAVLPAALSLTLTTAVAAFILQFVSPFVVWTAPPVQRLAAGTPFAEAVQSTALVGLVLTSLLLVAPILLVLRRRRPPLGTMAFLLTTVAALTSGMDQFSLGALILVPLAAGFGADLLLHALDGHACVPRHRTVSVLLPAVLSGGCLLVGALVYGDRWSPELTIGAVVLAGLGGLVLSVLMLPPARLLEVRVTVPPGAEAWAPPVGAGARTPAGAGSRPSR